MRTLNTSQRLFLSTSPLRGTTLSLLTSSAGLPISIHVPLAGDDARPVPTMIAQPGISIHVPLAGDDPVAQALIGVFTISIHVPLAGDDRQHPQ